MEIRFISVYWLFNKLCRVAGGLSSRIDELVFLRSTSVYNTLYLHVGQQGLFFLKKKCGTVILNNRNQPPIKRVRACASLIWLIICIISNHSGDGGGSSIHAELTYSVINNCVIKYTTIHSGVLFLKQGVQAIQAQRWSTTLQYFIRVYI